MNQSVKRRLCETHQTLTVNPLRLTDPVVLAALHTQTHSSMSDTVTYTRDQSHVRERVCTDPCRDLQPRVQSFSQTLHCSGVLVPHTTHTSQHRHTHISLHLPSKDLQMYVKHKPLPLFGQRAAPRLSEHVKLFIFRR